MSCDLFALQKNKYFFTFPETSFLKVTMMKCGNDRMQQCLNARMLKCGNARMLQGLKDAMHKCVNVERSTCPFLWGNLARAGIKCLNDVMYKGDDKRSVSRIISQNSKSKVELNT